MTKFQPLISADLRVEFTRQGDRIGHCVLVLVGGEWQEVLRSVEGTSDQDWPLSPPLKDLHFESRDGGVQLALLVGMAGKSHWSASIELDAIAQRLTFDVACRVRSAPDWLGSAYQLPAAQGISTDNQLQLAPGWSLRGEPLDSLAAPRFSTTDGDTRWLLRAPTMASLKFPQTIRWRYSISGG